MNASVSETWFEKICRLLMMKLLRQMNRGCLVLTLYTGETITLGSPGQFPQALIKVVKPSFFTRCVLAANIGFGEGYMFGDWYTDSICNVIEWFIVNFEQSTVMEGSRRKSLAINLLGIFNKISHRFRNNDLTNSRRNIEEHYDLSNDFFALFLDPSMTYSSAKFLFPGQALEDAQLAKYEALCQKLRLKPSDEVLEIGTGWGGFACYAAENYGCRIKTITISAQQFEYACQKIERLGLSDKITVELVDYRKVQGQFDKIVSIEMIEAVGDAYYETFFACLHKLLKPNGLVGIQMITCPDSRYELLKANVDFIQKHIFPGSLLPSIARVNQAINRTGDLFLYQLEDMGNSYASTLAAWHYAFNQKLSEVTKLGFDEVFIRKWNYYFQYCEAAFASRNITVVQAVYTRPNNNLLREE